jgi:hypothetical protein
MHMVSGYTQQNQIEATPAAGKFVAHAPDFH